MTWTEFRELSSKQRTDIWADKIRPACDDTLRSWNRDFPDQSITEELGYEFTGTFGELLFHHQDNPAVACLWARLPLSNEKANRSFEEPQNKGEFLISSLACYGPLCWGWRSPPNKKAKEGKLRGTLRRGLIQVFGDELR